MIGVIYRGRANNKRLLLYAALFVFIFVLSFFNINAHDDYSIPYGNDISGSIENALELGNGRYLGNFLGNWLSLRKIPTTIIKTVSIFIIILGASYIADDLSSKSLVLSMLLFLFPSAGIFSQCYGWSMGFYNYTVPIAFFVGGLCLIKSISNGFHTTRLTYIVITMLGIAQMFFSENTSLTILVAVLMGTIINKKKKAKGVFLAFLISSAIGCIAMFILPQILGVAERMNHYRSVLLPFSPINMYLIEILKKMFEVQSCISKMFVFWGLTCIVLSVYCIKSLRSYKHLLFVMIIPVSLLLASLLENFYFPIQKWNYIYFFVSVLMLSCETVAVVFFIKCGKTDLNEITTWIIDASVSAGMLLFVAPIGARCLLITYYFFAILLIRTAKNACSDSAGKYLSRLAFTALVAVYCILSSKMVSIWRLDNQRKNYIVQQIEEGKTEIDVLALPESKLLWYPNSIYAFPLVYNNGNPEEMIFALVERK